MFSVTAVRLSYEWLLQVLWMVTTSLTLVPTKSTLYRGKERSFNRLLTPDAVNKARISFGVTLTKVKRIIIKSWVSLLIKISLVVRFYSKNVVLRPSVAGLKEPRISWDVCSLQKCNGLLYNLYTVLSFYSTSYY